MRRMYDLLNAVAVTELTDENEPVVSVLYEDGSPPVVFCGHPQLQALSHAIRAVMEDSRLAAAKLGENG